MKKILFIATILFSINSFGQKLTGKVPGLRITKQEIASENDTIIKVVYKNEVENNKKPAYFINGKLINESVLRSLNPNDIATVKVEKNSIEIEKVNYHEQLYIVTKPTYKPKFITLNSLKLKYTNLTDKPTIFQIDNEIINANYDSYIVDENYILKIIVEKYENKKEKRNVNFIRLITKTEENIKKSKEIIIRGNNEFETNK